MKHLLLTLLFTTFLSACNSTPIYTPPSTNHTRTLPEGSPSPPVPQPTQPSQTLTYQDTDYFDTQLSQIAASQRETIAIPVSVRFEPDKGETPERLAKWVGVLKEGHGKQDYEEIKDPNAMSPALLSLAPLVLSWTIDWYHNYQEQQKYQPIQNYHARFCYRKYDNTVEKVVFVRKDVDSSKPVCFK